MHINVCIKAVPTLGTAHLDIRDIKYVYLICQIGGKGITQTFGKSYETYAEAEKVWSQMRADGEIS